VQLTVLEGMPDVRMKRCERYWSFRIKRRLQECGVPERLSVVTLSSLEPSPEVTQSFDAFQDAGLHQSAPKKIQILILGKRAREHGVALLRNTMRNFRNASYRAVRAPTLSREFRNALTTKQSSPMLGLTDYEVLLIDDIDEECLESKWFRSELKWLYETRRDQGLATIITSTTKVGEAFPGASVLRV
jgi:hypothetical protein